MGTRRGRDHISLAAATLMADTVTNLAADTAFSQKVTFKAGTLKVGDRVDFIAVVKAPTTNSTDTLVVKVKLADITLALNTAIDVADNAVICLQGFFVVQAVGVGGTAAITYGSISWAHGASATSLNQGAARATSSNFATTTDEDLTVTATWSAASTSDIARLELLHYTQTDGKLAV